MIKSKVLISHLITIVIVTICFIAGIYYSSVIREKQVPNEYKILEPYIKQDGFNLSNPINRTLFIATINTAYNSNIEKRNEILKAVEWYKTAQFTDNTLKAGNVKLGITGEKVSKYIGMFLTMSGIFTILLLLVYRSSIALGTFMFIKNQGKQLGYFTSLIETISKNNSSINTKAKKILSYSIKLLCLSALYTFLYSPAYVIAYSLKSGFDSGGFLFLILFTLLTNGLLISATERFYHLLQGEAQKGYYQTAIVKNLDCDYSQTSIKYFRLSNIFSVNPNYKGHVFHHIFINARHQYFLSIKEISLFLITGLIIIEMALNIQGHLFYSLLQDLLIHDYEMVLFTLYFLYLFIKIVEIVVDYLFLSRVKRFNNEL